MWCITRNGFVSLVEDRSNPHFIRARARRREHLTETFDLNETDNIIDLGPDAPDYRWHVSLPRIQVANVLAKAVMDIDYDSHVKEVVAGDDTAMYRAMLSCWSALHRLQTEPSDRWDASWQASDIAGIDPDFTGDETATEYVARRRGGWYGP